MERGERGRGGDTVPVVQLLTRREKKAKIRRFTCRWYQTPEVGGNPAIISLSRFLSHEHVGNKSRKALSTSDLGRRNQRVVFSSWGDFPDHRHRGQNLLPGGRSIMQSIFHQSSSLPCYPALGGEKRIRIRREEQKGRAELRAAEEQSSAFDHQRVSAFASPCLRIASATA